MNKNNLTLFLAIIIMALFVNKNSFSQEKTDSIHSNNRIEVKKIANEGPAFTVVEVMPEYPGGINALYKLLTDNLKYPKLAQENGTQGTVYITFVVGKDGYVKNMKVLRGIGDGCDEEALRVLKLMKQWTPGRQNGDNVAVQFNLPVKFTLEDKDSDKKNKKKKKFLIF